jgi:hypothetical protein
MAEYGEVMKLFKLEEANALIPMVRPILAIIKRSYRQMQTMEAEAKLAASDAALTGGGGMPHGGRYCQALLSMAEQTANLESLGVQIKDYGRGLIDFPSLREGRVVLLCWLHNESDQIEWWHELDAGFAGRQRI